MNNSNEHTPKNKTRSLLPNLDDSFYVVTAYLMRYLDSLRRARKKLTP